MMRFSIISTNNKNIYLQKLIRKCVANILLIQLYLLIKEKTEMESIIGVKILNKTTFSARKKFTNECLDLVLFKDKDQHTPIVWVHEWKKERNRERSNRCHK